MSVRKELVNFFEVISRKDWTMEDFKFTSSSKKVVNECDTELGDGLYPIEFVLELVEQKSNDPKYEKLLNLFALLLEYGADLVTIERDEDAEKIMEQIKSNYPKHEPIISKILELINSQRSRELGRIQGKKDINFLHEYRNRF